MYAFKCKMCGAALNIEQHKSITECEYCGVSQTLPKLDDEVIANLYDRANHFRRNNEFDKAEAIYEQILDKDNSDSEAYWSLALCRYGIEYVEDSATHRRIPTINRMQYTSIYDDDNYKLALQYADEEQKPIYEEEAKTINEIQKNILDISNKEEPFDVFISYKESDENGNRTIDSTLGYDIYDALTKEGLKVFFSRVTLEDKIGTAYEPYIFAALNSAKVMVVLGTKKEYFNSVWMKNEWSRYLAIVKQARGSKVLIPAYRDMDPYDLPEEFSHLQAQDMNKIGFMQDLVHGVKKIVKGVEVQKKEDRAAVEKRESIDNLLSRGDMFLEDGNWEQAEAYFNRVLDMKADEAKAYLGLILAKRQCKDMEALKHSRASLKKETEYNKILHFGSSEMIKELEEIEQYLVLDAKYFQARKIMDSANAGSDYLSAAEQLEQIASFKNSAELAKECRENASKADLYNEAMALRESGDSKGAARASEIYSSIRDWKDSEEQIIECREESKRLKRKEGWSTFNGMITLGWIIGIVILLGFGLLGSCML